MKVKRLLSRSPYKTLRQPSSTDLKTCECRESLFFVSSAECGISGLPSAHFRAVRPIKSTHNAAPELLSASRNTRDFPSSHLDKRLLSCSNSYDTSHPFVTMSFVPKCNRMCFSYLVILLLNNLPWVRGLTRASLFVIFGLLP